VSTEIYDVGAFVNEQLDAYLRKTELERAGYRSAEVEYELVEGGPLKRYLEFRRGKAAAALFELIDADPNDGVTIAQLQAVVRGFRDCAEWVAGEIEAGKQAEDTIEREYGNNGQASERYDD